MILDIKFYSFKPFGFVLFIKNDTVEKLLYKNKKNKKKLLLNIKLVVITLKK